MQTAMQNPVEQTSKTEAHSGKTIYKEHCAVCHGDKGNGSTWTQTGLNPPPRDFTSAESREQLTPERMTASVTFGRPGTAMMPFQTRLTAAQIANVVEYIRAAFIEAEGSGEAPVENEYDAMPGFGGAHGASDGGLPGSESAHTQTSVMAPADMSLPLPHDLVGNPQQGQQFYTANCFTCHGLKGDGRGPRSSFIHPPPRNFLAEQSRQALNRPALFKAISTGKPGTVMPAWGKVLSDQEIANVAEYVFNTFIQGADEIATERHGGTSGSGTQKKKAMKN
jgi:mono/diheme cytochrome c family protein